MDTVLIKRVKLKKNPALGTHEPSRTAPADLSARLEIISVFAATKVFVFISCFGFYVILVFILCNSIFIYFILWQILFVYFVIHIL